VKTEAGAFTLTAPNGEYPAIGDLFVSADATMTVGSCSGLATCSGEVSVWATVPATFAP
jgi:hypothetical protein